MSASYSEKLAAASRRCAEVQPAGFDLSLLPVSWDHNEETARVQPLLTMLRAATGDEVTFNSVIGDGGSEIRGYAESIGVAIGFPVVLAVLALLCCGLPLWICRCCAHRCCRHSAVPYSNRRKVACGGCWGLMLVMTLSFVAIGIIAGTTAVPAVKDTVCKADSFFRNTTAFFADVQDHVASIRQLAKEGVAKGTDMQADLQCLSQSFVNGAVYTSCAATDAARQAAAQIEKVMEDATGDSPSTYYPPWEPFASQLESTDILLCTTLPGYQSGVNIAQTSLNDVVSELGNVDSDLRQVSSSMSEAESGVRDAHDVLFDAQNEIWDKTSNSAVDWGAGTFFIPHLVLMILASCGVLCMIRRPVDKFCTVNGLGVQCTGYGWVCYTWFAPFLFVLSGLFIVVTLVSSDVGYIVVEGPKDPYWALGSSFCNKHQVSLGGASKVPVCNLVQGCFADSPVSLWTPLKATSSFNLTQIALEARDAIRQSGFENGSPFNVTDLERGAREARSLLISVQGLNASAFGVPPGQAYDQLNIALDSLRDNLTTATDAITETDDLRCATNVSNKIPPLLDLVDRALLEASDDAIADVLQCGFVRYRLEEVMNSSLQGTLRDTLGAVALCLLVAGVFALLLTIFSIGLQVQLGDVGIEPGCPSCCRCCCRYQPGANEKASRLLLMDSSNSGEPSSGSSSAPRGRTQNSISQVSSCDGHYVSVVPGNVAVVSGEPMPQKGYSETL